MDGWRERLADLLAGRGQQASDELEAGAQVRFVGTGLPPVPLARHHRVEEGEPMALWIRPIAGHYREDDGTDGYDLQVARRRALAFTAARLDEDGRVIFDLQDGGQARIEPAEPEAMAEISRWDAFTLGSLTARQEQTLDALETD